MEAYDPIKIVYGLLRRNKGLVTVKTRENFYVTGKIKLLKKIGEDVKVLLDDALITKTPINTIEAYERELSKRRSVDVYVSLFRDTQKLRMLT